MMNPAERNQLVQAPTGGISDPPGLAAASAQVLAGQNPQASAERQMDIYQDDRKLAEVVKKAHEECFDGRWVYERLWWRNPLYTLGRQWIYYNTQRGQWMDKRMARFIPRPVTNKIGEGVDAIRAVFGSVQLSAMARPLGETPENLMTAETADRLEPAIAAEHDMKSNLHMADFWLIETGNVILHPWWDAAPTTGAFVVKYERCTSCLQVHHPKAIADSQNRCPACGGNTFMEATDEQGLAVTQKLNVGKGCTDVLSPFEFAVPAYATSLDHADKMFRIRWRDRSYVEANYPLLAAKKINFEKMSPERSLQLMKSLASQSEISSGPLSGYSGEITKGEGVTEYELWQRPSREFPQGLVVRSIGGPGDFQIIRGSSGEKLPGPLPHWTNDGTAIIPFVHVPYNSFGARMWALSPLDRVVQKQDQLNQIDSLIQLAMQRTANPVWLEPKGAEVKKFTGEPGIVVKYQPVLFGAGAAKPERIEGSTIPAYVLNYRQQLVADIESGLGTYDVLKGGKPPGVEAFSAMQLLVERSQSRFTIPLAERGIGYQKWYSIAIELERLYGPDERKFSVLGPNGAWTFQAFKHANLHGAIEILVEDGSQAPKTNLGKRAAIESLNQLQLLNRADPDQVYTIMRTLGQTDLLPGLDTAIKSAMQEQDAFERWGSGPESQTLPPDPRAPMNQLGQAIDPVSLQPAPPQYVVPSPARVLKWHDHAVHVAQHKKWANSDAARQLFTRRPDLEMVWAQHLVDHEMAGAQDAMFQASLLLPAGGAGGGNSGASAPGGGQAMPGSNAESGRPGDVPGGSRDRGAQGRGPE